MFGEDTDQGEEYKFIFIERHGKEKEEELIEQFLKEYINRGFGLCKN